MKKMLMAACTLMLAVAGFAQTAEEIVQKHITALGGAEALKKVNTIESVGTMNVMGNDIELTIKQANNKGSRTDISVAGMSNYTIMTPTYGYRYFPVQGQTKPEPVTPEEVKKGIDDLDIQGSLVDYAAKGHTVEYIGKEDIEGTECHKLVLNRKNGGPQTLYIDPSSFLLVRASSKVSMNGQEVEVKSDMSDYKAVNGVLMPHSISQGFGTVKIKSIKVNEPIDDSVFAAPK